MADLFRRRDDIVAADRIGDHQFLEHRPLDARDRAAREHAVGDVRRDTRGASFLQRGGGVAERAARIDDIVDQDAEASLHLTDDVHHFGFARALTPFVDDRERRVIESLGERTRAHHAADIGRDDHQIVPTIARLDVGCDDGGGEQIVGRDIEESLDLPGMEIDRQHAVRTRDGDEVRDELGRNRRAGSWFAVLPGIAEIRDDGGDALGRRALQRIDANQQFHQIVVRRIAGRLQHEHILAADILLNLDEDFLIGETPDERIGQRKLKIRRDIARQRQIGIAGHQFHACRSPQSLRPLGARFAGGKGALPRSDALPRASA